MVTLQGWANSTCATYGAGLLMYHSFCDSREIPEKDHALANTALVSSFVLALQVPFQAKQFTTTFTVCECGILSMVCHGSCTRTRSAPC